ncbi:hypothetical protein M378DRAFT_159751 [Amanita muscaria Koide BX008]|uniref:Uncharacterized protein n=1 Tax=Amanita muscaria (strain Koide BX008) TaxID=946122 RepID=A0A0C2SV74_AMAMK|nr:hypothetical protein M378DRAFT_159751 [Amanita muscaria Koide BX008]
MGEGTYLCAFELFIWGCVLDVNGYPIRPSVGDSNTQRARKETFKTEVFRKVGSARYPAENSCRELLHTDTRTLRDAGTNVQHYMQSSSNWS